MSKQIDHRVRMTGNERTIFLFTLAIGAWTGVIGIGAATLHLVGLL